MNKKIFKNIGRCSEHKHYYKNYQLIQRLYSKIKGNTNIEITFLTYNSSLFFENSWVEIFYETVVEIQDKRQCKAYRIPFMLLVDIIHGPNYIQNWDDKKYQKRLARAWLELNRIKNH